MREQRPLGEYPGDLVTVACSKCDRRGRYAKARLVDRYGVGLGCNTLLLTISADCPRARPDAQGLTSCGAYFEELDAEAKRISAEIFRRG